ncbi:hypothetical protein [Thalassotalea profundi]|uniref:Uncharacterized protein n=1 Tax=Thalassotalea profundi TaxID=2036687 RepID=A0ABQ3IUQ8_9GAMM|nr:hypothetical protein [Thalassotalea profundi]GHE94886.1 hypothetical protein GCM10011501_25460 [Thalassotalea profundi]
MDVNFFQWLALIALPLLIFNYYRGGHGALYTIEVIENTLLLKQRFGSFVFKKFDTKIDMNKVVKLQKVNNTISFFYQSGHAIDVWHSQKNIDTFWRDLVNLFPNTQLVIIDQ